MTESNLSEDFESILFCNKEQTVILLDIPRSVAEAQLLSEAKHASKDDASKSMEPGYESTKPKNRRRWSIVSTPPLEEPYPGTTEPKTELGRQRVLSRIAESERQYHDEFIQPLVTAALKELQDSYSPDTRWCLPRVTRQEEEQENQQAKYEDTTYNKRNADHFQLSSSRTSGDDRSARYPVGPPTILSSTSTNAFPSLAELTGSLIKNQTSEPITLSIKSTEQDHDRGYSSSSAEYIVPPQSKFVHGQLPISDCGYRDSPTDIPGLPGNPKFNLILFDPPWPNRSVKRSRKYQTQEWYGMEDLSEWMQSVLTGHEYRCPVIPLGLGAPVTTPPAPPKMEPSLISEDGFAAIWITNSESARRIAYEVLIESGHDIFEEWVWLKVTANGQPVSPVDGIWRKPYEILVIGRQRKPVPEDTSVPDTVEVTVTVDPAAVDFARTQECSLNNSLLPGHGRDVSPDEIRRRVIAAVPDLHSRKPNLKSLFERILFTSNTETSESQPEPMQYSAMEVFARNLTAEWWACGNEVMKFNARDCWVESDETT